MDKIPVTHKGPLKNYDCHEDEYRHEDEHRLEDEHRHRAVNACSISLFRTLTAVATAASIILLLNSGETTYYRCLKVSEAWRQFDSFR
jgi:hypothetical protein